MEAIEIIDQKKLRETAVTAPSPVTETVLEPVSVSGSKAVLEAFIAEGVDTIFGYPGGAIMPTAAAGQEKYEAPPIPPGGPGAFPIHAAAGVEYGEGFAGNAHRHAPDGWMPAMKYLVEVLGADVNARDNDGYTPLHHAAARGDNEMILYLVSKGADVKKVNRRGQTTVDMANGPVQRTQPYPETIKLLMSMGATNNNRCVSC